MTLSRGATIPLLLWAACTQGVSAQSGSMAASILQQSFPAFQWQAETAVSVDIDADGFKDIAVMGYADSRAAIGIVFGAKSKATNPVQLDFARDQHDVQRGMCGKTAKLRVERQSTAPKDALGAFPEGYRICRNCFEIVVEDGRCDPMTIYWNRKRGHLDWWRI